MEKILKIDVRTLPNGYSLVLGKNSYMYHDIETLIMGIAYHAVDDHKKSSKLTNIANVINSHISLIKSFRTDTEKLLDKISDKESRIAELTAQIKELKKKLKS